MVQTLRGGTGRGLLSLSREMKVKKAETARYFPFSASTSEEASTNTSISIDLLLMNVSRPVTVTTEPWGDEEKDEISVVLTFMQYFGFLLLIHAIHTRRKSLYV